jgi:hypothetical protein
MTDDTPKSKWDPPHSDYEEIQGGYRLRGEYVTRHYIAEKLKMTHWGFRRNQRKGIFPNERFRGIGTTGEALFTLKEADAIIKGYRRWKKHKLKWKDLRAWIDEHSREDESNNKLS